MQSIFPRLPLSPGILKTARTSDEVFPSRAFFGSPPTPVQRSFPPTSRSRSTASDPSSGNHEVPVPMECSMEYLADLVKEKKQLELFPSIFPHMERLLDDEIARVRMTLFQCDFNTDDIRLPEPVGDVVSITEKLYVPKKEHPDDELGLIYRDGMRKTSSGRDNYNFVGRILGPRGMTAKQLEQETGCKIMVRGRGSMRDRRKEEMNRGKPNWEHLDDELHVLVQCEDTENRARTKLSAAVEQVKKLLTPAPEGTDELKRKQLMELAIINGTYRPHNKPIAPHTPRLVTPLFPVSPMRAPIMLSPQPSPNPGNGQMQLHHSPNYQAFDYSKFMNPNFLDALNSYPMNNNENMLPPLTPLGYPNGTSLVNSLNGGGFFHDSHQFNHSGNTSNSAITH